MDILYNNKLINDIVEKLFKHRRSDYSEYNLDILLNNLQINHRIIKVMNPTYQKIYASLFQSKSKTQICIVFLHGYGSNRLQCINLLKHLNEEYALCAFDFSASGKSEGDRITYGAKQKQDINSVIVYLRQIGFKKFVLWGRSMGATSSLLYCIKYNPKDVILQIIDSPFYSFQMIAFEIAQKNVKAPQFIINFAIQLAKKNCSKFINNPFSIQLNDVDKCKIDILFVYCEQDSVINSKNTHLICSKMKSKYQKLVIQQNHNTIRHQNTVLKIFQHIQKYALKDKLKNSKLDQSWLQQDSYETIYFCNPSKKIKDRLQKRQNPHHDNNRSISRKGIQRVQLKHNNINQYDDYGFTTTSPSSNNFFPNKKVNNKSRLQLNPTVYKTPSKRPYLSLSSSFDLNNSSQNSSKITSYGLQSSISSQIPSIYLTSFKAIQNDKPKLKKISTVKSIQINRSNYLHSRK